MLNIKKKGKERKRKDEVKVKSTMGCQHSSPVPTANDFYYLPTSSNNHQRISLMNEQVVPIETPGMCYNLSVGGRNIDDDGKKKNRKSNNIGSSRSFGISNRSDRSGNNSDESGSDGSSDFSSSFRSADTATPAPPLRRWKSKTTGAICQAVLEQRSLPARHQPRRYDVATAAEGGADEEATMTSVTSIASSSSSPTNVTKIISSVSASKTAATATATATTTMTQLSSSGLQVAGPFTDGSLELRDTSKRTIAKLTPQQGGTFEISCPRPFEEIVTSSSYFRQSAEFIKNKNKTKETNININVNRPAATYHLKRMNSTYRRRQRQVQDEQNQEQQQEQQEQEQQQKRSLGFATTMDGSNRRDTLHIDEETDEPYYFPWGTIRPVPNSLQYELCLEDSAQSTYTLHYCGQVLGPCQMKVVDDTTSQTTAYWKQDPMTRSWDVVIGPGVDPCLMVCFFSVVTTPETSRHLRTGPK